nr:hypothetical protein [Psychrobacter sp. PraFG1]UNK06076.1 hypothetical protein MN210_05185 [Psychrobacter sp. PraFG1]
MAAVSSRQRPKIQTVSRDGVVSKIQQLNRLETVAYNVDTVITSEQPGSWQRLWQDQQKGCLSRVAEWWRVWI